jgi:succinyl-CoA synthetase alpha subunit
VKGGSAKRDSREEVLAATRCQVAEAMGQSTSIGVGGNPSAPSSMTDLCEMRK